MQGLVLQRRHRLLTDGTLVPLISEHAAWATTQRLIAYGGGNDAIDAHATADAFIERLRERFVVRGLPATADSSMVVLLQWIIHALPKCQQDYEGFGCPNRSDAFWLSSLMSCHSGFVDGLGPVR
jgi:hypothetical protein